MNVHAALLRSFTSTRGPAIHDTMPQTPITSEQILTVIKDPKNRGRKLWTASVVLNRMGVFRRFEPHANYPKNARLRVAHATSKAAIDRGA